ncbi:hypothetical protein DIS24_g7429 [Lasiodiplodia hormozganensis]|uniref:Uncharacterized protein n=1 Tax=Lasiodiplodia hormozganensis TaxID=869390 RepID=A0AA39Y831_9PEZI|nr:hypothetical protein DIS24_g7429 [Lasiodiplodia hormozganensis]
MSAAGPSDEAALPAAHNSSDAEDSIALGSEDSDTDSSDEDEESSEEETLSLEEESDGGVPIVEDEDSDWEDNADEDEPPNYGRLLEGGRGYVHPDGREEVWYQQKVPDNPDAPSWTTLNSGLRDEFDKPVPVDSDEWLIAAASTKAEIEDYAPSHQKCNCSSIQLARLYDDLPYFNHENGYWMDPAAKNSRRTMQPFDQDTTRVNAEKAKKRKHAAIHDSHLDAGGSAAKANNDVSPTMLSSEVTVPQCNLHFPVTGILDEDWNFIAGSRYIKQRLYYKNTIDEAASSSSSDSDGTDEDDVDGEPFSPSPPPHTALDADNIPSNTGLEHDRSAADEPAAAAPAADSSYVQYVDQAYMLRLIEEDYKNPTCRKMNIHAPPRQWDCPASIAKLNRWITNFRERRRAAEMAAKQPQQQEHHQQKQGQEKPSRVIEAHSTGTGIKKYPWSIEELEAVKESMVLQLRETGKYKIAKLLEVLEARWPEKKRTRHALAMTLARYGLARRARDIVYGEEGEKEQAVEEADNGEADLEDNDDDEEIEVADSATDAGQ